ncbi:MAG: hypothetical protein E7240_09255 [Lachnospiraceae bacterium]|nr:hypothetical protein [Lachnospiraceae bacterium]
MDGKNRYIFEQETVLKAVLRLALPTILSQIILVVYNMADTFFISMTDSDIKLSAVTLCMPVFMILTAIANLFGAGGAAVMSRANGARKQQHAAWASVFSFYGCLFTTLLYSGAVALTLRGTVNLIGAVHPEMHREAAAYLLRTVVIGGIFTSMNALFSHLVRAEGRSFAAGFGVIFGSILNIALDPLFMFVLMPKGKEVQAVAAATAVSNAAGTVFFLILLLRIRKETAISFRFDRRCLRNGIAKEILKTGLPACLMTLMENVSYAVLGHLMATAGVTFQAGIGVAKKINMLAHCIARGTTQGVLPLIAYNYSAGNYKRMKKAFLISSAVSVFFSILCMAGSLAFGRQLVQIFIEEGASLAYGTRFLRILCIGCPFSAFAYAVISFLQAVRESRQSFILAMLRKGIVDIPLMLIIFELSHPSSIVWATPVTDFICCCAAAGIFAICLKKLKYTVKHRHREAERQMII